MVYSTWSIYSLLIVLAALICFYLWYERQGFSPKEAALVATMAALAGLGRVPFAAVPGFQPTTFIVLLSGFVFGPAAGFMVGSLAAFVSNMFLGQGPWTPWQMAAWGLAGISGGLLERWEKDLSRTAMMVIAFFWGLIFGWIVNTWHWLTFIYPLTFKSFLLIQLASIWFDVVHGVGNALLMFFMGQELIIILKRFKRRLTVSSLPPEEINKKL